MVLCVYTCVYILNQYYTFYPKTACVKAKYFNYFQNTDHNFLLLVEQLNMTRRNTFAAYGRWGAAAINYGDGSPGAFTDKWQPVSTGPSFIRMHLGSKKSQSWSRCHRTENRYVVFIRLNNLGIYQECCTVEKIFMSTLVRCLTSTCITTCKTTPLKSLKLLDYLRLTHHFSHKGFYSVHNILYNDFVRNQSMID